MGWREDIRDPGCTLCPLHESAEHVCLMGSGKRKSKIMIVGEAPGAREDDEHAAFVGPAGQLLTELLEEAGIAREECYITNAVKCRPPGNAQPSRSEAKICSNTYLTEEVRRLGPDYLLALGNTALQVTTGRSGITKYRGKTFKLGETLVFPTFHPAAALRSPRYLPSIRADVAAFARLLRGAPRDEAITRVKIIRNQAQLNWLIRQIAAASAVAFDVETTGLEEWHDASRIVTIGFSWEEGSAAVVPLFHPDGPWPRVDQVLRRLKSCLEGHPKLIAHNGKFDARWLAASGIFVRVAFDTMLAAHVLDENRAKGLKSLAQTHLAASDYALGDELKDAQAVPLKRLCLYNGKDCDYTLRLYHLFREELKQEPRKARLFVKLMTPAGNALTRIERGGLYVDEQRLRERTAKAAEVTAKLVAYMNRSAGCINYNSPQQVGRWLFGELGLPIIEETDKGAASTRESVLFQLEHQSKYVKALLKYRKWSKYLSTYLLPWEEHRDRRSRLHTNYRLSGTVTGRLSSSSPNLQQVPRDPFIRSILGAAPGWLFVEADYSQIELRIAAMYARETNMLRVLALGEDLHLNTAVAITRKIPADITKDDRVVWGKHPNFGLIYGMMPPKYVEYCRDEGLEVSLEEAERVYRLYHETYPRIRPWHDRQRRLAQRYSRVQSPLGRVRHLPDVQSSDRAVRAEAERQAINSPVQSLASDLMLVSLVRLEEILDSRVARVVGSVHDSLLFEIRESVVDEVVPQIRETMEDVTYLKRVFGADITVPVVVEVEVGKHWGEGSPVV